MITLENHLVISNIIQMRKAITGQEIDLDNIEKYDIGGMTYDELQELQDSLIPHYNEAVRSKQIKL